MNESDIDNFQNRNMNRSFITVIKKRSNQSNLMINNTKVTSQSKIMESV